MTLKLKPYIVPLSLGGAFFVLGLLRLNDLSLYTDSTRYLIWANSLAHLKGFVDETLPIPNRFVMNAPLYALILMPSQIVSSLSVVGAKVWTLLFGALAVGLFFQWLRRYFGVPLAIGGTLFFALNPMMLVISTEVLSEAPFIAAWMTLLILMDRQCSAENKGSRETYAFFLLLALIILIREVAMAVVAAAILHFLSRKEQKKALAAFLPGLVLYLLWTYRAITVGDAGQAGQDPNVQYIFQHFTTPSDASLISEFVGRLSLNLKGYLLDMGALLFYPFPNLTADPSSTLKGLASFLFGNRLVLLLLVSPFIVFGMVLDVRSSSSAFFRVLSIFFFFMILLFYPVHDLRFLLPLLPLGLFFVLHTVQSIAKKAALPGRTGLALAITSWSLLMFPNVLCDLEIFRTTMQFRSDPVNFSSRFMGSVPGYYRRAWSSAGEWIQASLPAGSVIASPAKEIAAFVRDHKVLEASRTVANPVFERLLRDHDAEYLLSFTLWGDLKTYEFQMNESRRFWFELIHEIGDISVFRIHRTLSEPNPHPQNRPPLSATPTSADYLRFGRYDFMNLRYSEALLGFTLSRNEEPRQPEPYFNLLVVHSAVSDTAGALRAFQALSGIPESTPYIPLAQEHLNLARLLRGASEAQIPQIRSTMATNAAIACWNLGYPRLAYRITTNVIKLDSSFFNAQLWASQIARQLGDTIPAYRHLRKLEIIDRTAPIVRDFQRVRQCEDSLRKARTDETKAGLHHSLSLIYRKLELREESIDEAESAVRLQPGKAVFWLHLAQMFEEKGARFAARRSYNQVLLIDPANTVALEKLRDQ